MSKKNLFIHLILGAVVGIIIGGVVLSVNNDDTNFLHIFGKPFYWLLTQGKNCSSLACAMYSYYSTWLGYISLGTLGGFISYLYKLKK